MKKAYVLVFKCGECPFSLTEQKTGIPGEDQCYKLNWKPVNPDSLDPACPLEDVEEKEAK